MKRLVFDASVIASWFDADGAGRTLRREYEAGMLAVIGPRQLPRDVLGLLAEHHGLDPHRLARAGAELERLGFELYEPSLVQLAGWIGRGIGSDRAAYLAVAAELDLSLVTEDAMLRQTVGARTRAPADA